MTTYLSDNVVDVKVRNSDILKGWLLAGTLDICCAIINTWVQSGRGPETIFRYISSGLMGKEAFADADAAAVVWLGLILHYLIAGAWTVFYFLAYGAVSARMNWVMRGILFGAVVWIVMNLVVVPLSQIGWRPVSVPSAALQMGILMVAIGLPLSFLQKNLPTD